MLLKVDFKMFLRFFLYVIFLSCIKLIVFASPSDNDSAEDEENDDVNKPQRRKIQRRSKSAVEDNMYDECMRIIESGRMIGLNHKYSNRERQIFNIVKTGDYGVGKVFDPVLNKWLKRILAAKEENGNIIIPKVSEKGGIVKHFYIQYKGEGARKLYDRISDLYSGISKKFIQSWLNNNEEHFRRKPLFMNKPPLQPVVEKTVQSTHQIDLVRLEPISVFRDGQEYTHVLSVIDIFSRFLQLRATQGKESKEIVKHLTEIYRYKGFIEVFIGKRYL